jgi:hypothetical protein
MALDEPKGWISLFGGIIILLLGLLPLLGQYGVIGFTLPAFLTGIVGVVFAWILAVGGLWLVIDGFMEDDSIQVVTIIVGIVIFALGLIPILKAFAVIGFGFDLSPIIYNIFFVIDGLFMVIASIAMR